tara:strand:- start:10071 stop:10457 length:387 start_codon:yes stop_codon:yes gene_type:complete
MPYVVTDMIGNAICTGTSFPPVPSLRAAYELVRQTALMPRVNAGYSEALLRNPGGVRRDCIFVVLGQQDKVVDNTAAIAFHYSASATNDTLVIIPDVGHYFVAYDDQLDKLVQVYNHAVTRCTHAAHS